jgi:lipid-A-disaccharide synthase
MSDGAHTFFFMAGEASGDRHGGLIIDALKQLHPTAQFTGVGGGHMIQAGLSPLLTLEPFEVMGLTDVIFALPRLSILFRKVRQEILAQNPDAVILIDYPGFNLRLAASLRKKGYKGKIFYYISPTVWAHSPKRVEVLAQHVDHLFTLFPFEKQYYSHTSLPVTYVGHPLAQEVLTHQPKSDWRKAVGIPKEATILGLFPGSRPGEITRNLKNQLRAIEQLQQTHPETIIAVSCASPHLAPLLKKGLGERKMVLVPSTYSYELMCESRVALAVSGTVNLELALHKTPTVVVYALGFIASVYAHFILKLALPYFSIVNILADRELFPEFIRKGFRVNTVVQQLEELFTESPQRQKVIEGCRQIESSLQEGGGAHKAAQVMTEALNV